MPRRRSSAQRSGSMPVSARTSVDLPWSTCPAVATTRAAASAARRHDPGRGGDRSAPARRRRAPGRSAGRAGSGRCSTRPTTGGSPPRSGAASARPAARPPSRAARSAGRAAAADHAGGRHDLGRARAAGEPRGAARRSGAQPVGVGVQAAERGRRRAAQRRLERGEGELVDAQRAGQRVAPQPLDDRRRGPAASRPAGRRAACRRCAVTTAAPARSAVAASGSSGSSGSGASSPLPMSATTGAPSPASSADADGGGEARRSGSCCGCTLRMQPVSGADRAPRSRRSVVRLVVPTSRSRAPVEAIRSGSRKPSPISTISPRLTTTSRPAASAVVASTSAAAPLLTTWTSPAAGTRAAQRGQRAAPAAGPLAGAEVELHVDVAGCACAIAAAAAADSGARPRLVCSTTPVALSTGRIEPGCAGSGGDRGLGRRLRRELSAPHSLERRDDRSLDRGGGRGAATAPASCGSASTASVRGTRRRGSVGGHAAPRWRRPADSLGSGRRTAGGDGRESNPPSRGARLHRF